MLIVFALATAMTLPATFSPCRIEGTRRSASCGTIMVHETRADPASRTIALRTVVFPAESRAKRDDPILFLAGGPGQGAASLGAIVLRLLDGVDRGRDVILVDVRGTGGSNPLTCEESGRVMRGPRNPSFDRCLASLKTRADLRQYTTATIAGDLDDVRQALGIEQWDLIAVSYGTRVAVEYLMAHASHVRAAILRGADPLDGKTFLHADRAANAALLAVITDCERERSCAMAFPALRHEAASIPPMLARQADVVEVTDPQTSKRRLLDAGYPLYHDLLYALMLDEVGRREVPAVIHRISAGGVAALARIAARELGGYDDVSAGLYYSVVCAEDDPRLSAEERREIALLESGAPQPDDRCDAWPHPDPLPPPVAVRNPGVPTLVISGADDPATPPAGARPLAARLGATHLLLPAGSHIPLFPGCAARLAREFLEKASASGIDARCLATASHQEFILRPPQ